MLNRGVKRQLTLKIINGDQQSHKFNSRIACNGLGICLGLCTVSGDCKHDADTSLVSFEDFKAAVVACGYGEPSFEQYEKFISGASKWGINSKIELAMFLAQIIHESGGLKHKVEAACRDTGCPGQYKTQGDVPGKNYYGRGYIQLTWSANYKEASEYLYKDLRLFFDPDQVALNEEVAWDTAFWYWMTKVHNSLGVSNGHFGATTKAINRIECSDGIPNCAAMKRFKNYKAVLAIFDRDKEYTIIENGCYN